MKGLPLAAVLMGSSRKPGEEPSKTEKADEAKRARKTALARLIKAVHEKDSDAADDAFDTATRLQFRMLEDEEGSE